MKGEEQLSPKVRGWTKTQARLTIVGSLALAVFGVFQIWLGYHGGYLSGVHPPRDAGRVAIGMVFCLGAVAVIILRIHYVRGSSARRTMGWVSIALGAVAVLVIALSPIFGGILPRLGDDIHHSEVGYLVLPLLTLGLFLIVGERKEPNGEG